MHCFEGGGRGMVKGRALTLKLVGLCGGGFYVVGIVVFNLVDLASCPGAFLGNR
jgi:hypothetical protein